MFLKCWRPGACESLKSAVCSISLESLMLSCTRHFDLRHFFRNHMPASKSLFELYMYPMWGELRLIYVKNLSFRSATKWGSAARIIKPPKECPIKLTRDRQLKGQKDCMYYLTSFARRSPISNKSPSVNSSFALDDRKSASGCASERLFLSNRISP